MQPKVTTEEHIGEWKVTLDAATLEDLFAEVARIIAREAGSPRSGWTDWETITVTARDRATLLADWANELLGKSEAERCAFSELRNVSIEELPDGSSTASAEVRGKRVSRWTSPLKAATYHGLTLDRHAGGWRATILFDV